jgi:Taurine catabolism dioxygenase TauD, TfdA family
LTRQQLAAMDLLDQMADSSQLRMDFDLQPGDIQLLHNHQILHARTAFTDHEVLYEQCDMSVTSTCNTTTTSCMLVRPSLTMRYSVH